jgi:adenosylhomocysteine nucleosidase
MEEEVGALGGSLRERDDVRRGPCTLQTGRLEGHRVIGAKCGIGKVNAAALTQALLAKGAAAVVFTGVAGATEPGLAVGDVVVSIDAVQHDVDVTPLGYALAEVPGDGVAWTAHPELVAAAVRAAREVAAESGSGASVVEGRVVSGDQFIASAERVTWLRDTLGATCAEMEGAAVAQICHKWGVPFVIVRSISDTADQDAHTDFRAFTRLAAERAEQVVRKMLRSL